MNIYVVTSHDDGRDDYTGDSYAIKFHDKQEAEKFLREKPAPYDTRKRQMLTEDQFLTAWTLPADAYTESAANDLGYFWNAYYNCWVGISVYEIDDYRNNKKWFDSEVDIAALQLVNNYNLRLDKREDKTMITHKLPKEFQRYYDEEDWEQTDEQLDQLVKSDNEEHRELAAYFGRDKDLDILVHDSGWIVRKAVACYGRDKDLDILVHDDDPDVRVAVADKGRDKDLDILVHDEDIEVRTTVAGFAREKDLDIFVHDEDEDIRANVAYYGQLKYLRILADDESSVVKDAVIESALKLLEEQQAN